MQRRRRNGSPAAAALIAADPPALLRTPDEVSSPVLRVILARALAGSRPGRRADDHLVCLAVEGGGMRGAVSAGMCVVLEAAGLVSAFDRIYGVSAGALNGSATAAGHAALSATNYQDAATRAVINPLRPLLGRPVVDFDHLFQDLIAARKPISFTGLATGPDFRALATSLETLSLRVLSGFTDPDELLQAVRASAALPTLGGRPPVFRGERMLDGGLIESIPVETAVREGATHVLVLRSRSAEYRQPRYGRVADRLLLRSHPGLAELVSDGARAYNRQAAKLELALDSGATCPVLQVTVPNHARLIGRLEANGARVVEALRLGAAAMADAIFTESIDLCWQPVACRTAAVTDAAEEPLPAPVGSWRARLRSGEASA